MTPDIRGGDVLLSMIRETNEAKVQKLLAGGASPLALALGELQVRVEALIKRTVGYDPRFEMEFEQALAQALEGLAKGGDSSEA